LIIHTDPALLICRTSHQPPTVMMIITITIQSDKASADYIHADHLGFHRQHFAGKAHRERKSVNRTQNVRF